MYLKHLLAWLPIVVIAFANAAIRQVVCARYFGELTAHQLATLTISILVAVYVWALSGLLKPQSPSQAIGVGLMWLVLTIAFETILGRYILGNPWSQVFEDYNVLGGRVWPLFLLWLTVSPYVFYKIRA